jgi:hypothetical protein
MGAEIILDPSIRDWVVLPMIIIFWSSGLVRHYVTLLLKTEKLGDKEEMRKMCYYISTVPCYL